MEGLVEYEILPRLELPELLRLRSVCKRWKALIFDPVFIRAFNQRHPNPPPPSGSTPLLFILNGGEFTLNPRKDNPSWVKENLLPCPTDPRGVFVASSGGFVCHAIHTYNEGGTITKTDFVISNPITGKYRELPTLVHFKHAAGLFVTMVVRDGVFHQLWVNFYATCVYDCFATKQVMEKRICNFEPGKLFSMSNGWFGFLAHLFSIPLCYLDSKIIVGFGEYDVFDVDDLSRVHIDESQRGRDREIPRPIEPVLPFMGKLVLILQRPRDFDQQVGELTVCRMSLDLEAGETHMEETLFRIKIDARINKWFATGGDTFYIAVPACDRGSSLAGLVLSLSSGCGEGGFLSGKQVTHPDCPLAVPLSLEAISLADPHAGGSGMSSCDWESLKLPPMVEEEEDVINMYYELI